MKKLIVGITIPGSIALLKGQLKHFSDIGYDACLLTQHNEKSLAYCERENCRPLDVKIERNISLVKDIKTLFALVRILKRERPDIVNFGTPKMGMLGMLASMICGIKKRIYTCRGLRYEPESGIKRMILKFCEKISGSCAHKIICISPSIKNKAVSDGLFKETKCVVINKGSSNGIDTSFFCREKVPFSETERLKESLGIKNKFVYGFLGRIVDRKGINELYEAFCKIYEKDKNCVLLLVGPWEMLQVEDKTIYDKVMSHKAILSPGRTDNVRLYFSVMDVFVLPGWGEGFGNVVVQAADMGLPVIGSKGTGICDAVCDGYNGINVEPKNVDALYKVMLQMRNDDELRNRLAANGPKWGQNFKSEIIWAGMDELYRK